MIIEVVLAQNITLVYKALDLQAIETRKLKGFMKGQVKPMVMDTPEMIVVMYPQSPLVIQLGDRRIRITLQKETKNLGEIPLWEIASKCNQLVSESIIVAYGFNYDIGVKLADKDAYAATINLLVPDRRMIEDALEGRLLSFLPRIKFKREQTLYDLVLEPKDKHHIKVHMNSHFESKDTPLPSETQLQGSFYGEYGYLTSMLPRLLLKGDK